MKKNVGNEIIYLSSPNINVCFKARISRDFSDEVFKKSVKTVENRHPILKCVIKTDANGQKVYQNGGGISIQFYSADELNWLEWRDETDNIPFDFENGPLVKIAVLRGVDYVDIVVLGHHIIGDGIGYLNLTRDFLKALDGCLDDEALELPEKNQLKKKNGGLLLHLFAKSLNKKWQKDSRNFSQTEFVKFFMQYREQNPAGVYLADTGKNFLPRLKAICKAREITINEAIATAFIRAVQTQNGGKKVRLGVAASIRNELNISAPHHMGNFVTGVAVEVENAEDTPFKLREQLSRPKKRYQAIHLLNKLERPLIESVMYAAYGGYNNPAAQKLAAILGEKKEDKAFGITNLGVQEFEGFSFTVDDVWFVGPAFPQNFLTVGVMTVGGVVKFCLRYSQSELNERQVDKIFQGVVKEVE